MNENIQELGWLCFWGTKITDMEIPPRVGKTPEQLGFGQKDLKVLRLPNGLETVGDSWFVNTNIERLIVSSSVKTLGKFAFYNCKQLREVVFEPGSCLERIEEDCFRECGLTRIVIPGSVQHIGEFSFYSCYQLCEVVFEPGSHLESVTDSCFFSCGLREIVVPRSVRAIGDGTFYGCRQLSSLRFEEGSQISSIGKGAFGATRLRAENVIYPDTFKSDGREWDDEFDEFY